jgi:Restriction endonuclease
MDWKSYEETTKYIYEQLGKSSNIEILGWGNSCKVTGKSGVQHQLDVLTSHSDGIHSYRTAIECKYWKHKVQKDTVTKLAEILEDAQLEKGVIVAKSGFTPDAITFAKYKNISLVELREPIDDDWEGCIKDVAIEMNFLMPDIHDYEFIQAPKGTQEKSEPMQFYGLTSDIIIHTPDGLSRSLHQITEEKLNTESDLKEGTKTFSVSFPDDSSLSIPQSDKRESIQEIRFKFTQKSVKQKIEIRGGDYVSMIMYSIFENKRFVMASDGEIRASEP